MPLAGAINNGLVGKGRMCDFKNQGIIVPKIRITSSSFFIYGPGCGLIYITSYAYNINECKLISRGVTPNIYYDTVQHYLYIEVKPDQELMILCSRDLYIVEGKDDDYNLFKKIM